MTLILPIVLVIGLGWRHYTYAGLELSVPEPNSNLLPNSDFDQSSRALPLWWQVNTHGNVAYVSGYDAGYVGGRTLTIDVKHSGDNGVVTLMSPKVTVIEGQTYLFKGYYKSYMKFAFLARYFYKDGTSKLIYLRDYRDDSGTWSTVSDAFVSGHAITAVQYLYKISSPGLLEINGVYLEPKQDVYIASVPGGRNVIPNNTLAPACGLDVPDQWLTYRSGSNTAVFQYDYEGGSPELEVALRDYKDGEAKWQYVPMPVHAHEAYRFGVSYESSTSVQVVTEYVMQDGTREFVPQTMLPPAYDWTDVSYSIEVPPGATTMFTSVILKASGTLATRDYSLVNVTRAGSLYWRRPIVSIAFDDGWQSAYKSALPLLNRYGFKSTFYINPSSIETSNFMNAHELQLLAATGNEIAAHGYAHDDMTAINDEALNYQLYEGRDYLRKAGFQVTDFATPYGSSDAEVQWYARQYFKTMRGTETGVNTRQGFDPYNLKILYIDSTTSLGTVATALQQAQRYDGWLILVYHQLGDTSLPAARTLKVEDTTITTAAFAEQLHLVQQSGIAVLPVARAFSEVEQQ